MQISPATIEDILGPGGLLSGWLKDFEFRSSQMKMAFLIQEAIQRGIPAIVEAGTGTGKTFGYLVPLILGAKKAVISTGTKNLQDQIFFKDLPLLRKACRLHIDAVLMKGRKNYLCLHKYRQFFSQPSLIETKLEGRRERLEAWLKKTEFADRAEIPWLSDDDALWDAISSSSEQCLGANCLFLEDCFLSRLRSSAARSKIIIVNHHLFFADLKVKTGGFGEIIPRFQVVVFDEAHDVEDVATSYFGESLSTQQLTELVADFEREMKILPGGRELKTKKNLQAIKNEAELLGSLFTGREEKGRLDQETHSLIEEGPGRKIGRNLRAILDRAGEELDLENPVFQSLLTRSQEMGRVLEKILKTRGRNWLPWYEKRKRNLWLHASPLDISERMREILYDKVQTVILTSATLSTNGNFDYIRSRLGLLEQVVDGIFPSHFSFQNQTLLYIPKDLPLPNDPDFGSRVAERILEILTRTEGRALILFTSHHNLNLVHGMIEGKVPFNVYRQGEAPRSVLLEAFKEDIHSVLLATRSFWQGVDVPGEALSCLIVDKLPFESPGEPLVAARIEAIQERGENPFTEYQVPTAIISLKQGLGRLVRKNTDRGVLCVLDVRILIRHYGQLFLNSLPRISMSHDLEDISRFFEKSSGSPPRCGKR